MQSAMGCHDAFPIELWCSGALLVIGSVMGLASAILTLGPSGSWTWPVCRWVFSACEVSGSCYPPLGGGFTGN